MPFHGHVIIVISALIESLGTAVVSIQSSLGIALIAVTSGVRARNLVVPSTLSDIHPAAGTRIAEAAALQVGIHAGLLGFLRHDVDGTHQTGRAIHTPRRTFNHLYALDFTDIHREIKSIMARLRITDIDGIKHDCHLLVITPRSEEISLSSNGSSLSHVYAYGILQQIIYTLYRRRLNFLTTQYSYHSRLLTQIGRASCRERV